VFNPSLITSRSCAVSSPAFWSSHDRFVRIEQHGSDDYEKLHWFMKELKFSKQIEQGGKRYDLPRVEYIRAYDPEVQIGTIEINVDLAAAQALGVGFLRRKQLIAKKLRESFDTLGEPAKRLTMRFSFRSFRSFQQGGCGE